MRQPYLNSRSLQHYFDVVEHCDTNYNGSVGVGVVLWNRVKKTFTASLIIKAEYLSCFEATCRLIMMYYDNSVAVPQFVM